MATKLEIWNKALVRIGADRLRTEDAKNEERYACERAWAGIVRETFRDADWNFARHTVALTLRASTPLQTRWDYEYAYPFKCEAIRRVIAASHDPTVDPGADFEVALATGDPTSKSVYTNQESALAVYTYEIDEIALWDAIFTDAVSWKLASDIALILTQSEKRRNDAMTMYGNRIALAKIDNIQEGRWDIDGEPDTLTASRE